MSQTALRVMLKKTFLLIVGLFFWAFSGWQLIGIVHHGSVLAGPKGAIRHYTFDDSAFYFITGISIWLMIFSFCTCAGVVGFRQFLHERWLKQFRRDHSRPW
jgi:hypothetical protein